MKLKEKQTLRTQTAAELAKQVGDLTKQIVGLRVGRFTKQVKDVREVKRLKSRIAVIRTIMAEQEIEAVSAK